MIRKSNTTAIVQLAKDKSEKTRIRVEKAISEMALKEEKINFNTVAQKANVSKSWLYKQKEIRIRVETLRGMQINELIPRSEDVLIKTLKSRIKALEEENELLKEQVQKLYGKLF